MNELKKWMNWNKERIEIMNELKYQINGNNDWIEIRNELIQGTNEL